MNGFGSQKCFDEIKTTVSPEGREALSAHMIGFLKRINNCGDEKQNTNKIRLAVFFFYTLWETVFKRNVSGESKVKEWSS